MTQPNKTLSDVPSPVVYHLLSNFIVSQLDPIYNLFVEHTPTFVFEDWPSHPPAGLLILMASKPGSLRSWALSQAERCSPLESLDSTSSYVVIFSAIAHCLPITLQDPETPREPPYKPSPLAPPLQMSRIDYPPELWVSIPSLLRLICSPGSLPVLSNLSGINFPSMIYELLRDEAARKSSFLP